MPPSKITNQYARRARITPIQSRVHKNNNASNALDLTSEEVYSLINTSGIKKTTEIEPQQPEPPRKSSFLKILMLFISLIVIIGTSVYVIDAKNGIIFDEKSKIRRHSAAVVDNNEVDNNSTMTKGGINAKSMQTARSKSKNILSVPNMAYGEKITLPSTVNVLANLMEPVATSDIPIFWHIPRSGGSTVKDITTSCLMLVQASQVGVAISKDDTELKVVEDIEGGKFMNVDTTTPHGINRAVQFGLASSPDLDLVVTPYVYLVTKLFDENHRGRMFTIMRHPIDRAVSLFHAMKVNKHTKSMLEDVTLEAYAKGSMVENNWMTRFLANQQNGELTLQHETIAKELLRTKFLIGILKYKDTSMSRFESYFGWKVQTQKGMDCRERLLDWNWSSKNIHPIVDTKSNAYKLLEQQNEYDIRLYEYAEKLFHDQEILFKKEKEEDIDGKEKEQEVGANYKPLAELKGDHRS